MNITKLLGTTALVVGLGGTVASNALAADLEFYFPVGVNAPAVETIQGMVDEWAAANPEHSVQAVYAGNYDETTTKALTAAQSGNPPQVAVLLATDIFTLVEEGVVTPISDLTDDQEWLDSFYPAFMADATYQDKIFAIPFQRSTPLFYYNIEAFEDAGLDPENPPETWDEMIEMGKQLVKTDANGNVSQWGTRIPTLDLGAAWLFAGLVKSKGDEVSTETGTEARIDTPAALASLNFLLQLADEGVMQEGGITWGDTPKAFIEGETASMWTSSGNLAFVRDNAEFEWGAAFLPGGDGPGAPLGGGNFYVFDQISPEEKEAAVSFIKHMTSADNAAKWSIATGYVATRADAWETPEMQAFVEEMPQVVAARDQVEYATREFATFQRQRVTQFLVDAIESVVTGQAEPEAALADAQAKADQVLADYQ